MIDPKLLELAFNNAVPADVKAAGKAHLQNLQDIDKAQSKIDAGRSDLSDAKDAAEASDAALQAILATWTPA